MHTDTWQDRVDRFWAEVDLDDEAAALAGMRALVEERDPDDPVALFEWAGIHDSLGLEEQAVPLYRRALAGGLDDYRTARATIQLASTLRNVGELDEAVDLLRAAPDVPELGGARQAVLALVLHSRGEPDAALREALTALADTLPRYQRSMRAYAAALTEPEA
ncbi:tetratricopeptide repeat protein [Cellulomonas alba]|uniref:Tetratricopeptide repeat protein n=1 Tax=Cellulomonas alba TaxID=3053467 RepID=A0ABT7SII9_9CELL|nr:tetratricopeptide repeat protein [Cellulomonas alba]MDM7855377.1 tetratricopeptide repeat protein [Cellulomonas alba]